MSKYTEKDFFALAPKSAFISREAELRGRKDWPRTKWYNDEDFCELYRVSLEIYNQLSACQKELAEQTKISHEVQEAVMLLRQFREIHKLSDGFTIEPAKSCGEYLAKQAEEAIKISHARRKDEYIELLQKELAEAQAEVQTLKHALSVSQQLNAEAISAYAGKVAKP